MSEEKKKAIEWYNPAKVLSYNRIWCFVMGNRGTGKSTSFIRLCINLWLKKKRRCIYVRRYESEMDEVLKNGLFKDMDLFFPGHNFDTKGYKGYCDGEIFMYMVPLSTAARIKSVNFSDVDIILFDEFIPNDMRFLGGANNYHYEVNACLNLYQTVARGKDKPIRDNVKFIFLANAVSMANPYFSFFDIDKKLYADTKFLKGKGYIVEQNRNESIAQEIEDSQFGSLIEGTTYAKYALDNKFLLDSDEFIEKMSGSCQYFCTIIFDNKKFGVFRDRKSDIIYITERYNDSCPLCFTFTNTDHKPNYLLLTSWRSDERIKFLRKCYDFGWVRFTSQRAKNAFLNCMEYVI